MSDIALRWSIYEADMAIEANDLAVDDGLQTAVIVSLFTDRRAAASDSLPDAQASRRGVWMDTFPASAGDLIGSRLWLLSREKQLQSVVERAREYAEEALRWLVEDKVAARVSVTAEIVRDGVLGLTIDIYRPTGATVKYTYNYAWAAQALAA